MTDDNASERTDQLQRAINDMTAPGRVFTDEDFKKFPPKVVFAPTRAVTPPGEAVEGTVNPATEPRYDLRPESYVRDFPIPPEQNMDAIRACADALIMFYPLRQIVVANINAGNGTWGNVFNARIPHAVMVGYDTINYGRYCYLNYDQFLLVDIHDPAQILKSPYMPANIVVGTTTPEKLHADLVACTYVWERTPIFLLTDKLVSTRLPTTQIWKVDGMEAYLYIWTHDVRFSRVSGQEGPYFTIPKAIKRPSEQFEHRVNAAVRRSKPEYYNTDAKSEDSTT